VETIPEVKVPVRSEAFSSERTGGDPFEDLHRGVVVVEDLALAACRINSWWAGAKRLAIA
jgi:hypothetical protein